MSPDLQAGHNPLDLLVANVNPETCVASMQQRVSAALSLLTTQGSASLPQVNTHLEDVIMLLNLVQSHLVKGSLSVSGNLTAKVAFADALREVQAATRLLGSVTENGLSLYSIRLAKLQTNLGGYTADGRPAQMESPQSVAAVG